MDGKEEEKEEGKEEPLLSFDSIAAIKKLQEETQPWAEKHRPTRLEGVVGQEGSVQTLRGLMLGENATFPHMILCGPAGAGKTTSAWAVARELYGEYCITATGNQQSLSDMVLELNGSDSNGIEVVRENITSFVSGAGSISRSMGITVAKNSDEKVEKVKRLEGEKQRILPKLIILDESDHLTLNAQNALRSMMEKYVDQVRFIFIVNYENRIIDAICSRCLRLRFPPLKTEDMIFLLKRICEKEHVDVEDAAIRAVVQVTGGDMRSAINNLQSCVMHARSLKQALVEETVYKITGKPPPSATRTLLKTCFERHNELQQNAGRIKDYLEQYGVSLKSTLDSLCQLIVDNPESYKDLGFTHEAAVAHFILGLEKEQRNVVLVTDSGRMKIHIAAIAALIRKIKIEQGV